MTTICQYYSFTSCSVPKKTRKKEVSCIFFSLSLFAVLLLFLFIRNCILPKRISSLSIFVFVKFFIEFSFIPFLFFFLMYHSELFIRVIYLSLFPQTYTRTHKRPRPRASMRSRSSRTVAATQCCSFHSAHMKLCHICFSKLVLLLVPFEICQKI